MPLPGLSTQPLVPTAAETGVVSGLLFAWGDSVEGHLGDGQAATDFSSPIAIGAQSWKMISCGGGNSSVSEGHGHTLAIRADGLLFAWGDNGAGQLGNGNTGTDQSSPVQIGASSWIFCATASTGSFAIRIDGLLFAWGQNSSGSVGDGTTVLRNSPVQIGASSWKFAAGGEECGFAIDVTGRLFGWGTGVSGVRGDGTSIDKSSPTQIGTSSWSLVSAGKTNFSTVAIRIDGLLFAWGDNASGKLGVNSATATFSSPVAIGASSWVHALMTGNGGQGVRVDGLLFGWGITTGTGVSTSSPVQVGAATWKTVWGSTSVRFAIDSNNLLWTWGGSTLGAMGTGATTSATSPIQVGTSLWKQVDSGQNLGLATQFSIGLKFP